MGGPQAKFDVVRSIFVATASTQRVAKANDQSHALRKVQVRAAQIGRPSARLGPPNNI